MQIGEKIRAVYERSGMKLTDFAEKIGTVRQNVYRIFEKEQIDVSLLIKISEVLSHDFFQYYFIEGYKNSENNIENSFDGEGSKLELEAAKKEIEHLQQIVTLREEERNLLEAKLKTNKDLTDAIIKHLREKEQQYVEQIRQIESDTKK